MAGHVKYKTLRKSAIQKSFHFRASRILSQKVVHPLVNDFEVPNLCASAALFEVLTIFPSAILVNDLYIMPCLHRRARGERFRRFGTLKSNSGAVTCCYYITQL